MDRLQSNAQPQQGISEFWSRVRAYVPGQKPAVSLFDGNPWQQSEGHRPEMDARAQQAFLTAQLAAIGLGGR
ncbi:hypothetical protein [Roseibium sp.]|uniref:hypothetical protein n=1 Tax=Roseibium sp. TaxID=1936156 RepID=UPI003A980361